jgi:hypothetical protein
MIRPVQKLSTFDAYSFVAVTALLLAAGLFACFWPARPGGSCGPIDRPAGRIAGFGLRTAPVIVTISDVFVETSVGLLFNSPL